LFRFSLDDRTTDGGREREREREKERDRKPWVNAKDLESAGSEKRKDPIRPIETRELSSTTVAAAAAAAAAVAAAAAAAAATAVVVVIVVIVIVHARRI